MLPELTQEQVNILNHTLRRAPRQAYCGDSLEMQGLVSFNLMRSLGKVSYVPDEYFTITPEGRKVLEYYERIH